MKFVLRDTSYSSAGCSPFGDSYLGLLLDEAAYPPDEAWVWLFPPEYKQQKTVTWRETRQLSVSHEPIDRYFLCIHRGFDHRTSR